MKTSEELTEMRLKLQEQRRHAALIREHLAGIRLDLKAIRKHLNDQSVAQLICCVETCVRDVDVRYVGAILDETEV